MKARYWWLLLIGVWLAATYFVYPAQMAVLWATAWSHVTQFRDGATTHGRIAMVVFGGLAVLMFGPLAWKVGKHFGKTELRQAQTSILELRRERDEFLSELQQANQDLKEARQDRQGAHTVSRSMQKQHHEAVMVSDKRGKTIRKLRQQIADLKAQLSGQRNGDIVSPHLGERHGS